MSRKKVIATVELDSKNITGVPCRQCEVFHDTLYDCPKLEEILPTGVGFNAVEFGKRMSLLINDQALPAHNFERDNQDLCHRCGAKYEAPWHK